MNIFVQTNRIASNTSSILDSRISPPYYTQKYPTSYSAQRKPYPLFSCPCTTHVQTTHAPTGRNGTFQDASICLSCNRQGTFHVSISFCGVGLRPSWISPYCYIAEKSDSYFSSCSATLSRIIFKISVLPK